MAKLPRRKGTSTGKGDPIVDQAANRFKKQVTEDSEEFSPERHLLNREWLIGRIRADVIGPDPGKSVVTEPSREGMYEFESWGAWRDVGQQANGEEVLTNDPPLKRFGAGILFPQESDLGEGLRESAVDQEDEDAKGSAIEPEQSKQSKTGIKAIQEMAEKDIPGDDEQEEDINLANAFRPSAIGLSFLSDLPNEMGDLIVEIRCARYKRAQARITSPAKDGGSRVYERTLWLRCPHKEKIAISPNEIVKGLTVTRDLLIGEDVSVPVKLVVTPRSIDDTSTSRVYSVSLVHAGINRPSNRSLDEQCLFQVELELSAAADDVGWVHPYPEPRRTNPEDEEEEIRLQYRMYKNFGIGHGCSVDWIVSSDRSDRCSRIWTDVMPQYETPSISPEALDAEGQKLYVSMRSLTELSASENCEGNAQIERLIDTYSLWIAQQKKSIDHEGMTVDGDRVESSLFRAANRITGQMDQCLDRIRCGKAFLLTDPLALKAFRLMNKSMLLAQMKSHHRKRMPHYENHTYVWPEPFDDNQDVGNWRSFQIAFILMCLQGICDPTHDDRSTVDLIWFATGGGKTEAYLGLVAFTAFYNRLSGCECDGADVFMRYTLRLLTSQQFQRATLLFCAMEYIRLYEELDGDGSSKLGVEPFRIGLWVGGTTTPNTQRQAVAKMAELEREPRYTENPFPVLKCPWCHAAMGPINLGKKTKKSDWHFPGYEISGSGQHKRIDFFCPDNNCPFSLYAGNGPLPVNIIDEDLYYSPPNLIISTIDKFAGIPFKPEIARLFGLNDQGRLNPGRIPPTLIIQDELHLISGPLGTVAGLYETLIEDLCCEHDTRGGCVRIPKVVASTATISRSGEQITALYARPESQIFPPPGLSASDSFFAHEETDQAGRLYMGLLAPNHGSQQTTQARVIATTLEATGRLPKLRRDNGHIVPAVDSEENIIAANPIERDPFWTIMLFFNSLRELGGAASLLVSDVPDYQKALWRRWGGPYKTRYPDTDKNGVVELTSRISGNTIPDIMETLENSYPGKGRHRPIDVCLATNIIEVGIDIDRLSLMGIIGQPKTTAQYIQVSSRIGRRTERPGLVVVIYQAQRPRDRSFYEHFRVFHSRLYAQVEPTSVTPFSPPAIMRALHAIVVGYARMHGYGKTPVPSPYAGKDNHMLSLLRNLIKKRVECVDTGEKEATLSSLESLIQRWIAVPPQVYGDYFYKEADLPLIHPAGAESRPEWQPAPWPTMTSMRNVDVTCEGEVTPFYSEMQQEKDGL